MSGTLHKTRGRRWRSDVFIFSQRAKRLKDYSSEFNRWRRRRSFFFFKLLQKDEVLLNQCDDMKVNLLVRIFLSF